MKQIIRKLGSHNHLLPKIEHRYIVDRDITDSVLDGIYLTINDAIKSAYQQYISGKQGTFIIKIASNLYEESLYINVPNLIIEPKEKGGEVTLQQNFKPCLIIDVGEGNSVMIKNTKLLFVPVDSEAFQIILNEHIELKKKRIIQQEGGNAQANRKLMQEKIKNMHECVKNFYAENEDESENIQLVYVKSGTLILSGCHLSVEAPLNRRARCIYQRPNTTTQISYCKLRGGGPQKNITVGVYMDNANSIIQNCQFHNFKSGGVVADLNQNCDFIFRENAMVSCHLASVFVQGIGSKPVIVKNVFMACKNISIIITNAVKGFISLNTL